MLKNILNLLILWGVLCVGILATVADEDFKESSDVVIREKRVIHRHPHEDVPVQISDFPYIVNIKKLNRSICVGTIVSPSTVITAASCIKYSEALYNVYSGSSNAAEGVRHTVQSKRFHYVYRKRSSWDGIVLLNVLPHFTYNAHTRNLQLSEEPVIESNLVDVTVHGTVSGWGVNPRGPSGTQHPLALRTIRVPVLDTTSCAGFYGRIIKIDNSHVCTYHSPGHTGETDIGAPLVVDGRLVGVHLLGGSFKLPNKPDVFANLQHPEYFHWLRFNVGGIVTRHYI